MKSVIIIEPNQPTALLINTASILGVILGDERKNIRGKDTFDLEGNIHKGVVKVPLPILQAGYEQIKEIWQKAKNQDNLFVADFSNVAQSCKSYEEYIEKCKNSSIDDFRFLGLALYVDKKKINKLTGFLKAFR